MSAQRGLVQRPVGDWAFMQVRLSPDLARAVKAAARKSGMSYSYYLSTILEKICADRGGNLPVLTSSDLEGERASSTDEPALLN